MFQEKTVDLEQKTKDLTKERDSLTRQLNQNLPQVCKLDINMPKLFNNEIPTNDTLTDQK